MNIYILILIFVIAYCLDMATALLVKRFKPGLFNANEDNRRFKAFLDRYGTPKGITLFILSYSIQYILMFILAGLCTYALLSRTFSWPLGIILGITFLAFFHFIAMVTNLLTLLKKDTLIGQPAIQPIQQPQSQPTLTFPPKVQETKVEEVKPLA